ncbi:hypothetical protein RIEGSTA812A_PEG_251 [invertebrate metagenome]|uniref:Uncharacterized protein n=1 Tax=invertebrate metagenome TaxID=1711999 RepID=A0A484H9C8_9ZZZZ
MESKTGQVLHADHADSAEDPNHLESLTKMITTLCVPFQAEERAQEP